MASQRSEDDDNLVTAALNNYPDYKKDEGESALRKERANERARKRAEGTVRQSVSCYKPCTDERSNALIRGDLGCKKYL